MLDQFLVLRNSPSPIIDASLGVGMVGGVKAYYAVLLALVLGVGCGGGKEKAKAPASSVVATTTNAAPQAKATPKAEPKGDTTPKTEPKVEVKNPEPPKAEPVNIADPIVEKAVREGLKKPEGKLTEADFLGKEPRLILIRTQITDAGLKDLAKLPKLKRLYLNHTQITDVGLKELAKLQKLTYLGLTGCKQVTVAGVAELQKALPNCKIHSNPTK